MFVRYSSLTKSTLSVFIKTSHLGKTAVNNFLSCGHPGQTEVRKNVCILPNRGQHSLTIVQTDLLRLLLLLFLLSSLSLELKKKPEVRSLTGIHS